jgi:oligopeptide/dipeptide ABC transporter ATP-binding protein
MDSIPRHDITEKNALCPIKGQPPSLIGAPDACTFAPRCPYAQDICRTKNPPLRVLDGSHAAACHFAGEPGFTKEALECAGVSA